MRRSSHVTKPSAAKSQKSRSAIALSSAAYAIKIRAPFEIRKEILPELVTANTPNPSISTTAERCNERSIRWESSSRFMAFPTESPVLPGSDCSKPRQTGGLPTAQRTNDLVYYTIHLVRGVTWVDAACFRHFIG